MFLEITEKESYNVVVYSRNILDFDENFRIIYKDSINKKHQKIKYSDMVEFINYPASKNLILYRLMTNYENINAADSQFGMILYIDEKNELVYPDPVFALKDLNYLVKNFNLQSFRFKIQQIGLKTLSFFQNREHFTQIYCYDLHAIEAQNQNDKIFADALYPEEHDFMENPELPYLSDSQHMSILESEIINKQPEISDKIIEDFHNSENNLLSPQTEENSNVPLVRQDKKEILKKVLGIEENSNSNVPSSISDINPTESGSNDYYSDLFKNTNKNSTTKKGKDSVILKLTIS